MSHVKAGGSAKNVHNNAGHRLRVGELNIELLDLLVG